MKNYDIIIVGAGPAGCACAHQLSGKGLRIAVIDKDTFPRDKICGDALSPDVVAQLFRMGIALGQDFEQTVAKKGTHGVRLFAPNQTSVDVTMASTEHTHAPGYVSKRIDFDNFMFNQIKNLPDVETFEQHKVIKITITPEAVTVETDHETLHAKTIVGADGANSVVRRQLLKTNIERAHHYAGLRQYYQNVTGFHEKNHVELHFYDDILPGYFWIFPLPNNQANVGIGMSATEISKRRINLKEKLAHIIQHHPAVKDRFKNATPLETVKGFGLPVGSKKRACSGHRFLLLGDAACLIDPFSGEGIGNALRSGRIAATHLVQAFQENKFDEQYNKLFDRGLYAKLWREFQFSKFFLNILSYPKLFNAIFGIANKSKVVSKLLTGIIDNRDLKKSLVSPSFYYRLLFK